MRANVMDKAIVVWADGSYDTSRDCLMCGVSTCNMPVHTEKYKIKVVGALDAIEEKQEVSELLEMGIDETPIAEIDTYVAKEDIGEDDYATE